jgi:hypothetical protein
MKRPWWIQLWLWWKRRHCDHEEYIYYTGEPDCKSHMIYVCCKCGRVEFKVHHPGGSFRDADWEIYHNGKLIIDNPHIRDNSGRSVPIREWPEERVFLNR